MMASNHVTDPSLLYTVSFGLLGSNVDDTPLAPTKRPERSLAPDTSALEPQGRSLLNIITFGALGRSADETVTPTEPPPGTPVEE